MPNNKKEPIVECQMMIRKPVKEVLNAFVDPKITTHFWFTKSSGRLQEGKIITWTWEMYGMSTKVLVKKITGHKKITIQWLQSSMTVDFEFEKIDDNKTYVLIRQHGFNETGDELIASIKDNTGGFTTVLDGLKAYLEHGIDLNLIADKYPQKAK